MGFAKEMWLAEVEKIEEAISSGELTIDEGASALRAKGLDLDEAQGMARVAVGEEP